MAAPRPRFRFRSEHAGLSLVGLGWSAQFRDGRFETDDERTAQGIARRGDQHPEYGISLVRGSDKPDAPEGMTPTGTPAEPVTS